MQFDDLKEAWATHGTMLERNLAINVRLLREVLLHKALFAIAPYVLWRALEVALGFMALVVVMSVLATHVTEPRYAVVGGTLAVLTGVITALCAYLLVKSLKLDYGKPVTEIQREVEHMRLVEYRALKWALLAGMVAWLPAGLVLFEALTGVDALTRIDLPWLIANLVFGLALLALGHLLSRRYVERPDLGPRARRLVEALSGRALRSAAGHLAELAKFEREEPPAVSTIITDDNKMKTKLLLFIFTLSTLGVSSQTICDSVNIEPDTFYINQSLDTVVFDTLKFIGQGDISYSTCYFKFFDTTYIDIKEIAITNGVSGPFTFTKWNGYKIIYNTSNIPVNTIVNAQYGVYHQGIPNPTIDRLLPVTFIINGTTGIESLHKESRLKIYPNPFSTQTTLQTGNIFNDATLTVYNCFGQTLKQIKSISGQTITLHRDNLPSGLYFIQLTQHNKVITTDKLVIMD